MEIAATNEMLKIGLTGGIGSGKSEVSKFFDLWGAYIFDADQEAKAIIDKNKIAQKEIIEEFGTDVVNKENKIEKKKLARIAFQDDFHQSKLNAIVHPYVFKKIDETFQKIAQEDVTSLLRYRTERVMSKGQISRDDFMKRVDLQWSDEDKEHLADYVIQNNTDIETLEKESKKIFETLF